MVSTTKDETNITSCNSTDSADSGVDMLSLTQLIDERINLVVDTKLKKQEHTICRNNIEPLSNHEFVITPTHTDTEQDREKNIIIHGLKEGEIHGLKEEGVTQSTSIVKELFETLEFTQHLTTSADRLGAK